MKTSKLCSIFIIAAIVLLSLSSCSLKQLEDQSVYLTEAPEVKELSDEIKNQAGAFENFMTPVTENDSYSFAMNRNTAEFVITDKQSGEKFFSNPPNWINAANIEKTVGYQLGSQIIVNCYSPENKQIALTSYFDSFLLSQIETKEIKNGIKVNYLLGQVSVKTNYPQIIRKTELDSLISKLSEEEQKKITGRYRIVDAGTATKKALDEIVIDYPDFPKYGQAYILRPNLGKTILENLDKAFKNLGYDTSDADKEHGMLGYIDKAPPKAAFLIPVEYTLNGSCFSAEIISSEIKYTKGFSLTGVSLLPYFCAADRSSDGYFVVPDGSGAIINLNKDTSYGALYSQKIYGEDPALTQTRKSSYTNQAYMPIFGIKTEKTAVLGVIDKGAALASVNASLSGVSSEYNNIYSVFEPKAVDYLSYDGLMTASGTNVFPAVTSKESFKVNYYFESGKDTSYTGLALLYRDYLMQNGSIGGFTDEKSLPLFLELLGAIDKKETVVGIPVTKTEPLTKYNEAVDILKKLAEKGIENISLKYKGWSNGGINNTVFSKAEPLNALGGKKEFESLITYLNENNHSFYPDLELCYVYKDKLFDSFSPKKSTARQINKQLAVKRSIDFSTGLASLAGASSKYLLRPADTVKNLQLSLKSLEKYGISSVSLESLGNTVSGDYYEKEVTDREKALRMITNALGTNLKAKALIDGGNAHMLKYASGILNMPLDASRFSVEDRPVPFYQIALHGYLPYAGEAVNLAKDYKRNILKSAETGSALYVSFMNAENESLLDTDRSDLYALSYSTWFDDVTELYKVYSEKIGPVINSPIKNHLYITGEVTVTEFENGYRVYVNYSEKDQSFDGIDVPAGDYISVKRP